MQTATATMDSIAHLSSDKLNERARRAADKVRLSCIAVVRNEDVVAMDAARLGCAHLGDVERLEALALRAQQVMDFGRKRRQ